MRRGLDRAHGSRGADRESLAQRERRMGNRNVRAARRLVDDIAQAGGGKRDLHPIAARGNRAQPNARLPCPRADRRLAFHG